MTSNIKVFIVTMWEQDDDTTPQVLSVHQSHETAKAAAIAFHDDFVDDEEDPVPLEWVDNQGDDSYFIYEITEKELMP